MVTRAATLAERLREIPPADRVLDARATCLPYAYDVSFWSVGKQRALAVVVLPRSTAEVQGVVRFADATGTAVVPRGAGTGQTGGAVAARGGIVISFARMREIIEIDRRNLQVVVEPGIVFSDLQDALRPQGLFFPPDPGSGRACTLGGMAANNASGPHAVRWGTTSAYVLGAEVVLADGSVITTGGARSKALQSSSGIDLAKLWAARTALAAAAALAHPDRHRIFAGEDLAVPLSEIPRTIRRAREMSAELHIAVIFYGHFGDGNVHSAILIDPSDADEVRRADELADRLHRLAIEVGGTVTGEHGTGAVRQPYMRAEHGDTRDLIRRVKAALDPKGIMNPGKIYGSSDPA